MSTRTAFLRWLSALPRTLRKNPLLNFELYSNFSANFSLASRSFSFGNLRISTTEGSSE
ncbi:hypothetical protein KC19_VG336900 [Ceratodon purpureus]|uniref:Uncharacterized protein n=1 Tax=Ceratodon purpureus TaxID=3225 RepID=A0A8T0HXD0_CERPU|nr:hypothetical protein KC19_VG336900 [Ceratodon purpureus]